VIATELAMNRSNLLPRVRRTLWLAIAILWVTPAVMATQPANQKKGFNANDVYQFNGIDSVNTFNGNLTLAIPIGSSYSVGGGLSYGLTLFSNANVWESVQHCHPIGGNPNVCQTVCPRFGGCDNVGDRQMPNYMLPHRRANAGVGWTLSLGRLYQPEHPAMAEHEVWTYESPDGSDHSFETADPNTVSYTSDGTYLRMTREVDPNNGTRYIRKIEFPNGDIHIFEDPAATPPLKAEDHWRLRRITNRFAGNFLDVTYGTVPTVPDSWRWTLTDSHGRTHWVDFLRMAYNEDPGVAGVLDHTRMILSDVYLSVYGSEKAHFHFVQEETQLNRSAYHTDVYHLNEGSDWRTATVQTLSQVVLPDGAGYSFTYRNGQALEANGVPLTMTVPTGGMTEWDWETYYKPWSSASNDKEYWRVSYGVRERKLLGRVPSGGGARPLIGKWTYSPSLDCDPTRPELAVDFCREFTNTITDPLDNKTVNYFSVSTDWHPIAPWDATQYGLPFTKKVSDGTGTNPRWLSQQVFKADGTLLRSTYVRYAAEPGFPATPSYTEWQRESERVVYEDDNHNYMDSDSSDWDLYGHYRTQVTSGSISGTRKITRTTHYLAPTASSWITSLYDYTSVTDDAGRTYRTDYCFNSSTGFLNRQHTRKDPYDAASPTVRAADLLAVFSPDSRGNVTQERYYGGDLNPTAARQGGGARLAGAAGSGTSCAGPVGTLAYQIDHTRVEPTATADGSLISKYATVDVPFTDVTIDRRSGLISSSRDTAGVATNYEYDWAGRILKETPTARAVTEYSYITPASFEITVSKTMAGSSEPLPWSKYLIDAFGRVVRETTALPGGAQSERNIVYNALGWRMSVSEPGNAAALTQFTYDALGQVKQVTAPDGSLTDYSYVGSRQKTRTSRIWTGGPSDTTVDTTEYYDGYGNLRSVSEKSGATSATSRIGATVVTEYGYDVANHLISVTMNRPISGSGTMQQRLFDYDGRGFLRWESQPESGMSAYFYDARGHLVTKTQSAAASQFDLDYFYDAAERVTLVQGRNPLFGTPGEPPFRPLKEFFYGAANTPVSLSKGKLTSAVRYNYVRGTNVAAYHTYFYEDDAGRLTARYTDIAELGSAGWIPLKEWYVGQIYTPLDLPMRTDYPMCENCGGPEVDPWRENAMRTYDRGRLTSVASFVPSITYWANGLRNVLQHANGVLDTQTTDSSMPRPASIKFNTYDRCVQPSFTVQPASTTITSGQFADLSVTVAGTTPVTYDWYKGYGVPVAVTPSIHVNPLETTDYYVIVTNACGFAQSQAAKVSVGACTPPTTGVIVPVLQPNGSWSLTPDPTSQASPSYLWTRLSDGATMGTSRTLAVNALTQTTSYRLKITDGCGNSSSDVTITVPLQITSTALTATANAANTQITVTWPAVTGATSYNVYRRSGSVWEPQGTSTSTTYVDSTVAGSRAYAYRVQALASGNASPYSNSDIAITMSFTQAVPDMPILAATNEGLLVAVNKVRAAVGWPALTWNDILTTSSPLPAPGEFIDSRHVTACRARMNEALQALAVPVTAYSDGDVTDRPIRAAHINELLQRAQ
jgi:YD repeat-containing protein